MSTIVWPADDPFVYNTLIVGPHVIPGRAELLNGIESARDIDVKKAKGKSGATTQDNGAVPQVIKYRIHQWRREHHERWQVIFPQINPNREGATNEPFEIMNAYTWEQDIHEVTITRILPGPYTKGKRIVEIDFRPWTVKPKEVKKGTGTAKPAATDVRAMTGDLLGMSLAPGQLEPELARDPSSEAAIQSMVGELMGMSR